MPDTQARPSRRIPISRRHMTAARRRRGLNYTQLAETIGRWPISHQVSAARLGQIEAGHGHPSPELFHALAAALGIPENDLRR